MNDGDRSHWLRPSPPIAVDGEGPEARKPGPRVLPQETRSVPADENAEPVREAEDAPAT
jgi:hypothetical protein